ncbi:MAG TPA: response regulator [Bradyrhizobium sp.]|uniref:response regulator transcription factor n=1 Tax=Bradyrhizobium sp. TaxID=376 RepID=UPI002C26FCD6|nr:response regulator [Bradyrhizobium sp.]HLZ00598.1 response regulator [Bradyrhizobium sp.]
MPSLILVVEDEYPLQGIVEETLIERGFAADILSSGEEALTLFRGGTKEYKALVIDVSLKGRLNGWDVARQIREKDPAFPIVYMTAATANEWASQGVPSSLLLQKPFAPAELVAALSNLLHLVAAPSPRAALAEDKAGLDRAKPASGWLRKSE